MTILPHGKRVALAFIAVRLHHNFFAAKQKAISVGAGR
jgi:hypothetical protein